MMLALSPCVFVDEIQLIFAVLLPVPHSFLCGTLYWLSAGFVSILSSKPDSLVFSHERFESFGYVLMFVNGVLGRSPKWASNRSTFVIAFGVMRSLSISSATSDASLYDLLFLSSFKTANLDFRVLISRSTIPIALWSSTGANINLI